MQKWQWSFTHRQPWPVSDPVWIRRPLQDSSRTHLPRARSRLELQLVHLMPDDLETQVLPPSLPGWPQFRGHASAVGGGVAVGGTVVVGQGSATAVQHVRWQLSAKSVHRSATRTNSHDSRAKTSFRASHGLQRATSVDDGVGADAGEGSDVVGEGVLGAGVVGSSSAVAGANVVGFGVVWGAGVAVVHGCGCSVQHVRWQLFANSPHQFWPARQAQDSVSDSSSRPAHGSQRGTATAVVDSAVVAAAAVDAWGLVHGTGGSEQQVEAHPLRCSRQRPLSRKCPQTSQSKLKR